MILYNIQYLNSNFNKIISMVRLNHIMCHLKLRPQHQKKIINLNYYFDKYKLILKKIYNNGRDYY